MLTIPSLSPGIKTYVAFTSLKNAFAMCVSDTALTFFENSNEIAAVLEEAKETAKNYAFSSMVCIFTLSTVIQCAIQSY
jgi:phosphotransacetylase